MKRYLTDFAVGCSVRFHSPGSIYIFTIRTWTGQKLEVSKIIQLYMLYTFRKMPPPNSKSDAPHANVTIVRRNQPVANESLTLGPMRLDILEDGSNTDRRLSAIRIFVPPQTLGPAQHWHQMHDETFLVEKGTATFTSRDAKIQAHEGDYVVVPTCSPHTFGNETEEELVLYCTFTPAFYVDYFRVFAAMLAKAEGKMTPEIARAAMERYATLQTEVTSEW